MTSDEWLRRANDRRWNLLIGLCFAGLLLVPYLIKGQHVWIPEHDYLDQIDRLGTFKDGKLTESSSHPFRWLVHEVGFLPAYVINEVAYRLVAFIGMLLLVSRLARSFEPPQLLKTLIACAFAALPFWPHGQLSVAGIPLVLYAAINLRDRKHVGVSLALMVFHASWSSMVLSGIFLIALLVAFLIYEALHKRWHPMLLLGVAVLAATYTVTNSALFEIASDTLGGESSRSEMKRSEYRGEKLQKSVARMWDLLTGAHYHAPSNHRRLMLPSAIACVAFLVARRQWRCQRLVIAFLAFLAFTGVVYASFYSAYFLPLYERLGFGFNYTRWYFLTPAIWYGVWGAVLANTLRAAEKPIRAMAVTTVLVLAQAGANVYEYAGDLVSRRPTFADFVSTELFDRVKDSLTLAQGELVGCVGFHPSAARYNELPTIDFYKSAYSLAEKRKIASIIQPVMDRSPTIARYFQHWGSRAYLFDDEIGTYLSAQSRMRRIPSIEVNFDIQALRQNKVKYLLSTVPFRNASQAGYRLVHQDDNGYYRMFVYQVY